MIGQRNRDQLEFMVCGSIRDLLPDDHVLVRVDADLDLSWLHGMVEGLYADGFGRPGVEPEAALRLMLAGFLLGFVQDRRLMRGAQVNLAIRWFAGFGLTERLPDHSSLTRIRQRWGEEQFRAIFTRVVQNCQHKGLVAGDVIHMDASLIRANVSFDSLVAQHLEAVADEGPEAEERLSRSSGKYKKLCVTDADAAASLAPLVRATLAAATSSAGRHLEPSYKQHTAVDDRAGTAPTRRVHITRHYVATLRARRRRLAWTAADRRLYTRHRWMVEGVHGLAKTLHGLNRAVRRALTNRKIQALMTAIAINPKRMPKALFLLRVSVWPFRETNQPQTA